MPFFFLAIPVFKKVPPLLVTPMQYSTFREICDAEGFPAPMLNWTRLVVPLPVGKTDVKEGNLTIRNLSPADSGFYECVAKNNMGIKRARMNMVVQKLPKGLYLIKV